MTTGKSLTARIDALEQAGSHLDDAAMLAWGQDVTDDELRQVASQHGNVRYLVTRPMVDAVLFRMVRPAIEALRTQGAAI